MAASVDFTGTWKLESTSPNFEDMLRAMKLGLVVRKAIVNLKPEHVIKQDGDNFNILMKTAIRNQEITFKIGEEFEQMNLLENKMNRLIATWEGDSMVIKALTDDNLPVFTRTLQDDGKLRVTQKKGELEVYRIFVKV